MVVNERASLKMDLSDGISSHSEEEEDSDMDDVDNDDDSQTSIKAVPSKHTAISLFSGCNGQSIFAGLPTPHISFDGLNSGVPTRTTPTLTPTTLRNIEQTFYELQCPDNSERHSNEARFVPPSVKPTGNNNHHHHHYSSPSSNHHLESTTINLPVPSSLLLGSSTAAPAANSTLVADTAQAPNIYTTSTLHNMNKSVMQWHHLTQQHTISPPGPSSISQDCNSSDSGSSYGTMRPTPPVTPHRQPMMTPTTLDDAASAGDTMTSPPPPSYGNHSISTGTGRGRGGARKNVGGRKPQREANLSPAEEERRQLRRERNKAAAARCRKRRVDHTNMLTEEVDGLEMKKRDLHAELQNMRLVKEELEMILAHHQKDGSLCKADSITPRSNPNLNTTLRKAMDVKLPPYINNSQLLLPTATIKTEYDDYNETMDYNDDDDDFSSADEHEQTRDVFQAPKNNRIMLTHASLPPVIMRPSRPNSLNVLANPSQPKPIDSLAGIMNSTPSSGLQFNFDSLMVGGTGLTPVAGPLMPTSMHCGSLQQQQLRLSTTTANATSMADMMMGGNVELNTPDVSHKFMLSL